MEFSRTCRAQPRAKLTHIEVLIKPRRNVIEEALIDCLYNRQFVSTHAAGDGKDRKNAALVTGHTVVIAVPQFPTPFDSDRTVATISAEVVFEVNIRDS